MSTREDVPPTAAAPAPAAVPVSVPSPGPQPTPLRCAFAYAAPGLELCLELDLRPGATAADARDAARARVEAGALAPSGAIPWDAPECGIFGQITGWETPLEDGDRVEIYRPLQADPRISRRSRVEAARRRAGGTPALGVSGRGGRGLG